MAEAGEKVQTVSALRPQRQGAGLRAGRQKPGNGVGAHGSGEEEGQCLCQGAEAGSQPYAGCRAREGSLGTVSATASLHRGGGGKMEAAEPGPAREGGFRSASGAAVEPRLKSWRVSLPRDIGDMTKFISTREFFSETKLEDFGAVVPLIGCSPKDPRPQVALSQGKKKSTKKPPKTVVPCPFRYFLNVSLLSQYLDRQLSYAIFVGLGCLKVGES